MLLSSTVSWSVGERLSGPWALGKEGSKCTSWGASLSGSCSGCQLVMGTRLSLQEEDMCQVAQIFTVVPCFIGKYNGSCSHQLPQSRSGRLKSGPSMSQSLSGAFVPSVSDGLEGAHSRLRSSERGGALAPASLYVVQPSSIRLPKPCPSQERLTRKEYRIYPWNGKRLPIVKVIKSCILIQLYNYICLWSFILRKHEECYRVMSGGKIVK